MIQAGFHPGLYRKGAYPAHCMADQLHCLLRGQHLGLAAEGLLEFMVIDFGVPGRYHQQRAVRRHKGKCFGDAGRNDPHRLGGQLHRCTGGIKFQHPILHSPCRKKRFHFPN